MKHVKNFFQKGIAVPALLGSIALVGLFTAISAVTTPLSDTSAPASMTLAPYEGLFITDETFSVQVVVSSKVPVNVFGGEMNFNQEVLRVESIDYNTSIADLWAEKPWYSNGEGTLNFIGGTTRPGGFTGSDTLLTVTFKTIGEGSGTLFLRDAHILQHDGLGTEIPLPEPIDAIFTITDEHTKEVLPQSEAIPSSLFTVLNKAPNTDLNDDGKQTIADTSIFMLHLSTGNTRSDFNNDGSVNTKDLSILLDTQ